MRNLKHETFTKIRYWGRSAESWLDSPGLKSASCRHEDGTVRFWDASGVALTPLYKLSTANVFHTDCDPIDDPHDSCDDPDMQQQQEEEEEWPPFRKVNSRVLLPQFRRVWLPAGMNPETPQTVFMCLNLKQAHFIVLII